MKDQVTIARESLEQIAMLCPFTDDKAINNQIAEIARVIEATLVALSTAPPPGHKIVPVEATPLQLEAGQKAWRGDTLKRSSTLYRAMVYAAPPMPSLPIDRVECSITSALAELERRVPGSFWVMAKGRVKAGEPLYGAQILFGEDEIIGEGEGDTPAQALANALLIAAGYQPARGRRQ